MADYKGRFLLNHVTKILRPFLLYFVVFMLMLKPPRFWSLDAVIMVSRRFLMTLLLLLMCEWCWTWTRLRINFVMTKTWTRNTQPCVIKLWFSQVRWPLLACRQSHTNQCKYHSGCGNLICKIFTKFLSAKEIFQTTTKKIVLLRIYRSNAKCTAPFLAVLTKLHGSARHGFWISQIWISFGYNFGYQPAHLSVFFSRHATTRHGFSW